MRTNPRSLSLIAWGCPSDPRTFSGYSRSLASALREQGLLRSEYSAKQLKVTDLLRGAVRLRWHGGSLRPEVRRAWMWSRRANDLLTARVDRSICRRGDTGDFLQVGTLVQVDPSRGRHFVLTDMTIPQAARANHFGIEEICGRQLDEAIAVQASVLAGAAHVFTLTEWARRSIIADFNIDPRRVTPVYAGSNLQLPEGLTARRIPRQILFVGMDWKRKGGPLLLDALRLVRRRLPDATLRIVGCSPAVNEPGVMVEGLLDVRDTAQYQRLGAAYLSASCFCLPSSFDPFPNVIIEAATAGLPTVALDNGSRREAVIDGETGALAAAPDAVTLADALVDVLEDEGRCRAMGERARAHAQRNFTWSRAVGRICAAAFGWSTVVSTSLSVVAREPE